MDEDRKTGNPQELDPQLYSIMEGFVDYMNHLTPRHATFSIESPAIQHLCPFKPKGTFLSFSDDPHIASRRDLMCGLKYDSDHEKRHDRIGHLVAEFGYHKINADQADALFGLVFKAYKPFMLDGQEVPACYISVMQYVTDASMLSMRRQDGIPRKYFKHQLGFHKSLKHCIDVIDQDAFKGLDKVVREAA